MKPNKNLLNIFDRRFSARSYTGEVIDENTINEILSCALKAPSSGNMQPWEFIIVKSEEKKREIVSTTFTGFFAGNDNQQTWIMKSGFLLVLGANIKRTKARYGEQGSIYWPVIDTTIAGEHAVLAAAALGIGSCWIGGFDEVKLKDMLNMPSYIKPVAILSFGYIDKPSERLYRMPVELVTHHEVYGER